MTYWSLFAGAGGIDLGLERSGHRCLVQVECDRDANRVRRRHWPHVEHVRDVIGMSRRKWWHDRWERPELIVGGFPCQDLSVAGKRAGLTGNRSGLWWQMLRIITGMRPDYVLWENVPGLLSSDGGRDFERVICSLGERGYFGCTRVLDARYFGVPQRRRRVFGLFARGHLGAERCREILAVGTGVSGDSPKGGEAREDFADSLEASLGRRGGQPSCGSRVGHLISPSVTAKWAKGSGGPAGDECQNLIAHSLTANGFDASEDGTGRGTPIVPVAFNWNMTNASESNSVCPTIRAQKGCGSGMPAIAFQERGRPGGRELEIGGDVAYALTAPKDGGRSQERNVLTQTAVRRLTPRECERLMGWPDDHTRWDDEGKELKDGPRYRLCGNGVVANVAEWIGKRLNGAP